MNELSLHLNADLGRNQIILLLRNCRHKYAYRIRARLFQVTPAIGFPTEADRVLLSPNVLLPAGHAISMQPRLTASVEAWVPHGYKEQQLPEWLSV